MGIRTRNRNNRDIFEEFTVDKNAGNTQSDIRNRAGKSARKPKKEETDASLSVQAPVRTVEIMPRKPRKKRYSELPPKLDDSNDDSVVIRTIREDIENEEREAASDIMPFRARKESKRLSLNERNERRLRAEAAARRAEEEKRQEAEARRREAEERRRLKEQEILKRQAARERLLEEKRLKEKLKREEELTARLKELREEKDRELEELERIRQEKEQLIAEQQRALAELKADTEKLLKEKIKAEKKADADNETDTNSETVSDSDVNPGLNSEPNTGLNSDSNSEANSYLNSEPKDIDNNLEENSDHTSDADSDLDGNLDDSSEESLENPSETSSENASETAESNENNAEADWSQPPTESIEPSGEENDKAPFYKKKAFMAAAAVTVIAAGAYGGGIYYYSQRFLPNTYAESVAIGGLTAEEADEKLAKSSIAESITLVGRDSTELLDLSEANAGITEASLKDAINAQNHAAWLPAYLSKDKEQVNFSVLCDEEALIKAIDKLSMLDPANITYPEDAHAGTDPVTGEYGIIPETEGNEIDRVKLEEAVKKALSDGMLSVDLDQNGVYIEPAVRADDTYLTDNIGTMQKLNRAGAVLNLGGNMTEAFDGEKLFGFLGADGRSDSDKLRALIADYAERFNTVNADGIRTVITHKGEEKQIKTGYGWLLDEEASFNVIFDLITRVAETTLSEGADAADIDTSQFNVDLVWKQSAAVHGDTDYGNTYVEIDMGEQNVYIFSEGQCVFETPCVTGRMTRDRATPEGMYAIRFKQTNRVLTGYNKDGSVSYRSPVKYWMPFNRGIGLHDASWRRTFGGEIYKNSGSHGCINLPRDAAAQIYELVYKGMPVICYY